MPTGARLARTSDVDDIAAIQVRAWHQSYAGVLPEAVLADLDPMHLASAWASGILNPPTTRHRLLVAIDGASDGASDGAPGGASGGSADRGSGGDTVVGYAAIGPSSDPDCLDDPGTGELLALVVDPAHQRRGHGSRLMSASVDYLRADGSTEANTWAPVGDEARRAFLLGCGWGPDSAFRDIEAGGAIIREVRLATTLG